MRLDPSLHKHLLGVFLLASGCQEAYEDFIIERRTLECELNVACGRDNDCSSFAEHTWDKSVCEKFRQQKADECIDALESYLQYIESDPPDQAGLCESKPWFELAPCREAIESRDGPACRPDDVVTGRPLRHAGESLLARVDRGDVWSEHPLALTADPTTARAAAEYWLRVARAEHASVAAFSRVSMELMAVGAPPELLADCHRAAIDEIHHAQLALDLARALGEPNWDLGPMPLAPTRPASLEQVALDALIEGCIGEGGAAASAQLAAERADEAVAPRLRRIARDETRHAALAWKTLRWALGQDRSLAAVLRRALDQATTERRARLGSAASASPEQAALGVTTAGEALRVELDVLDRIVSPLLDGLIEASR